MSQSMENEIMDLEKKEDCYFEKDGYCLHSLKTCKKICKFAVREFEGFSFRDHFDIFLRQKEINRDFKIRWLAVYISFLALIVSFIGVLTK